MSKYTTYVYQERDEYGYYLGTWVGHLRLPSDYLYYATKSYNCKSAAQIELQLQLMRMDK